MLLIKIIFRLTLKSQLLFQKIKRSYYVSIYGGRLLIEPTSVLGSDWTIQLLSLAAKVQFEKRSSLGMRAEITTGGKVLFQENVQVANNLRVFGMENTTLTLNKGVIIEDNFSCELKTAESRVIIGENVHFKRFCSVMTQGGEVEIGQKVFFNNSCSINSLEKVVIGSNTLLGENVKIYDHNHIYKDSKVPVAEQGYTTGPVIIGQNCWIGSNVVILKNVVIGDNCVIGANNLIYKSIPAGSVVKSGNSTAIN